MKKYYKEYKLVPKFLKNGKIKNEVEYTGIYYINRQSRSELIKEKLYCLILALISDVILISIGFLNASGSRVFYIAIPYACLFLPAFFCLMGVLRLIASGDRLEHVAYDRSVNRIFRSVIGQIVISSIIVIGNIGYLISIMNIEKMYSDIIFLCGIIIVLLLNIFILRFRKRIIYEAEKPVAS